jgi:hypothetical protein
VLFSHVKLEVRDRAKDQDTFIHEERKKPGSARDLDSQEKENKR